MTASQPSFPSAACATPILATRALSKHFAGVVALRAVDFELYAAEIHALCGENGAGKSTLIKILSGVYGVDDYRGEILVDGEVAAFHSTADAERAGISVIHQELALIGGLSVAENIALGHEPLRHGLVDRLEMDRRTRQLSDRFGIDLDPDARVASLGMGQQQLVEILRALGKETRILILDEPTAALSETETRRLLAILVDLKRRGISCLFITHRLDEAFSIADRITVIRDGATIATAGITETTREAVIRQMVGREVTECFVRTSRTPGPAMLAVSGLGVDPHGADGMRLRDISFTVHAGEVLGIGGLMGSGRSELLLHLFGAYGRRVAGSVHLAGVPMNGTSPWNAIQQGLVLVSEDRKRFGLVRDRSIGFNLSLSCIERFSACGLIDREREHHAATRIAERLHITPSGLDGQVRTLSGGNQQKVVLGKALMTAPRVILLDEPTRGIDIAAKAEVHQLIDDLTAAGNAVVLVSSELSELMGLADRILMIGGGRPGGSFLRGAVTADQLLAAALRASEQARRSHPRATVTAGSGTGP